MSRMTENSSWLALLVLAFPLLLPIVPALGSTVSAVSITLPKLVADSRSIVLGTVERVGNFPSQPATAGGEPGLRCFEVRIEQVLKPAATRPPKPAPGTLLRIFDPQEKFRRDHAKMIAAGVISYTEPRYPTKVATVSPSQRLLFFLGELSESPGPGAPNAYLLTCSGSYESISQKSVVLRLLKTR